MSNEVNEKLKAEVYNVLKKVKDPEHPIPITEMGIVLPEDITVTEDEIKVVFRPTSPFCPMGAVIGFVIKYALNENFPRYKVTVRVKEGTHINEYGINKALENNNVYLRNIEKLKEHGILQRCYKS